ncbi:MAG: family 10 glycosylhydrolase [Bacteroidota bacterium]|nr:family 10 glycosylhydrolase [Bacteroidota bacterium]
MKNFYTVLLLTILYCLPHFPQVKNQEWRADWVITWEYINGSSTVDANKARIRTILDNMKAANKNAVLWQVRQGGTAYYQSSYEPWGPYAGGTYPGFDPLKYAIDEAHKRGMELHVWFNCFAVGTAQGSPGQVHPEWICRDQNGNPMTANIALSPGMDAVRNYTLKVAMEVVRNYDIDGFHFDYVRWNEYSSTKSSQKFAKEQENRAFDGDIPDAQIKDIKENLASRYLYDADHPYSAGIPTGYTTWDQWWRASVTDIVKRMHDSIQTVKPWIRLSGAVLGRYNWGDWNGYYDVYQDAALWFNNGYMDQLTPMSYHWQDGTGFYNMLVGGGTQSWGNYIQPGITAGRMFTTGPGSYLITNFSKHAEIVNACRTVAWNDGFQFFSYGTWLDKDYFNTAGTTFFAKNTKPRSVKFVSTPTSPVVALAKVDSLHYNLTVTPQGMPISKSWFVVYRSTNTNFDKDTSEIYKIVYADSAFVLNLAFTGLQNYNGQYRYSVAMANRYWNESAFSNIVTTDNIPSYAPVVASSTPKQNDTVDVSTKLIFNFSKQLDASSNFLSAISVVPSTAISGYTLTNGGKTLTYTPAASLAFDTPFTVTLNNAIKDVNGKQIDGNGDGVPGDPFTLHFRTILHDVTGPRIVASDPVVNQQDVDVESPINLSMSEIVDSSTVTASNVILKKNGGVVAAVVLHTKINGKSIVTVKTAASLACNTDYSITLKKEIKDLSGNLMFADTTINFKTKSYQYTTKTMIDDFNNVTGWEQPTFSGSTVGVIPVSCNFTYTTANYLPGTSPAKSAYINYAWDMTATTHFIREYLSTGTPRNITFDTSYVLQVYVYGDSSLNQFRFALDESVGTTWPNHEVSKWYPIDWYGWKLIEWPLSDTTYTGTWIGNGRLDGTSYRIDSFQLTDQPGSDSTGRIYVDNLRAVKKEYTTGVFYQNKIVQNYKLYPNYPNPFNPSTTISFDLAKSGSVKLEIFDILGRHVKTLVNKEMKTGSYQVVFDASNLSSGKYIYRLSTPDYQASQIMILIK